MIQIKPYIESGSKCKCGGEYKFEELLWQGLHVCEKSVCNNCNKKRILSLPVNQSVLEQYIFLPENNLITNMNGDVQNPNWYSSKLAAVSDPDDSPVRVDIEMLQPSSEVLILNTLDYIYGHSLLFLMNLQNLLKAKERPGIVVIVQPMLKWLIPKEGISEIWTVNLGFNEFSRFHSLLSDRINQELERFVCVWLSKGHPIPTNEKIEIERFTGIKPFDFGVASGVRITFVWREDPDRLWIRNILILKGFKKLGLSWLLFPFHLHRVHRFFKLVHNRLGDNYKYTVAGLGRSGGLPSWVEDKRITTFDEEKERALCRIYSESILVIGVHGSSMILPSAHAGMAISLMPSKRWGNFAEDILFTEDDVRLSAFQRRIIPLNLNMRDLIDIAADMITGRDYFLKKFVHTDDL